MSHAFGNRLYIDLVLGEDCGVGIPEFSPGQPGDAALFHQAVIRFDIKTAVMALHIFMAADVAQIQEPWIRSFAFFLALSFHKKFLAKEINIAVPESGDLRNPQTGSDGKEHGQINHGFLLFTQI